MAVLMVMVLVHLIVMIRNRQHKESERKKNARKLY